MEAEAIMEAEVIMEDGWEAIVAIVDELVIGLPPAAIVGDWLIIGDEPPLEGADDGVDEWQPARASASTRPPPTGASRARGRLVRMVPHSWRIYPVGPRGEGSSRQSGRWRGRIGFAYCDPDHSTFR